MNVPNDTKSSVPVVKKTSTSRRESLLLPPSKSKLSSTNVLPTPATASVQGSHIPAHPPKPLEKANIQLKTVASKDKENKLSNSTEVSELEYKLQMTTLECESLREVASRCQSELTTLRTFAEVERESYEAQIEELTSALRKMEQQLSESTSSKSKGDSNRIQEKLKEARDRQGYDLLNKLLHSSFSDIDKSNIKTANILANATRSVSIVDI